MRRTFATELDIAMQTDERLWLITGDLGFGMWDSIRDHFPQRFINTGASEQAMVDIAVGLAVSGKIPFVYSITSFLIFRPFESIRNYLNHEQIPVKLVGSGRDKDYLHDGYSHWSEEVEGLMLDFHNIESYWPDTKMQIPSMLKKMIKNDKPSFISLRREA